MLQLLPKCLYERKSKWQPLTWHYGVQWLLADNSRYNTLREQARNYAVKHFSNAAVVPQYLAVYDAAIKAQS